MLTNVEVVSFHFFLGVFYGSGGVLVFNGLPLLHAHPLHDHLDPIAAEDAHQIVFQTQVETA